MAGLEAWEEALAGEGMMRADLLKDWIALLTEAYETAIEDYFGEGGELSASVDDQKKLDGIGLSREAVELKHNRARHLKLVSVDPKGSA